MRPRLDGESDADADAQADGGACVALDAGLPDCTPDGGNFATCGRAVATSTYPGWPASKSNDGVLATSWFAATGACPSNACPGADGGAVEAGAVIGVTVTLDQPRTVGRVRLYGNREYSTGYDTLTARIELLAPSGEILRAYPVTTSRGTEPNGDVEQVVSPAQTCVQKVRVVVLTGESSGPAFAEIEAYAN